MKLRLILKTTTNNSIYNKVNKERNAHCSRCIWHRGCNRKHSYSYRIKNWKKYRKFQFKEKKINIPFKHIIQ